MVNNGEMVDHGQCLMLGNRRPKMVNPFSYPETEPRKPENHEQPSIIINPTIGKAC